MKRSNGRFEEAALSRVLSPYQESALVDCLEAARPLESGAATPVHPPG
jgi:hypothetical protein